MNKLKKYAYLDGYMNKKAVTAEKPAADKSATIKEALRKLSK